MLGFGRGERLATLWQCPVAPPPGRQRRVLPDVVMRLLGFLFCLWIWLGLKMPAKIVGGTWLLLGLAYSAIKTRGFRTRPVAIDVEG
jgi:hypothetical protein